MFTFYLYVSVPMVCVRGACVGQNRVSDLMELELQTVVSHSVWVLGSKLGFSGRTASKHS